MPTSTRPGKESIALICVIINLDCIMILNNALAQNCRSSRIQFGKKGADTFPLRKQPKI